MDLPIRQEGLVKHKKLPFGLIGLAAVVWPPVIMCRHMVSEAAECV